MKTGYSKDALKFLNKQNKNTVTLIRTKIKQNLTIKPPTGNVVKLEGYNDNRKRLKIGKWRVIFRHDVENKKDILKIIDIDSRGDIYK